MKCTYCGEEIREGAKFCTQCGMPVMPMAQVEPEVPVQEPVQEPVQPAEPEPMYRETTPAPEAKPADNGPASGYMSYTSYTSSAPGPQQPRREQPAAPVRPAAAAPRGRGDRSWASGVALACAVFSVSGFWLVLPGLFCGIAAIVFAILGKDSSLKPLSVIAIVGGIIGILISIGMIFLWAGALDLFHMVVEEFPPIM